MHTAWIPHSDKQQLVEVLKKSDRQIYKELLCIDSNPIKHLFPSYRKTGTWIRQIILCRLISGLE